MKRSIALSVVVLASAACSEPQAPTSDAGDLPLAAAFEGEENVLDQVNAGLIGLEYRAGVAEYYTDPESGEMGNVIFANDRGNKQLVGDFVPGDPRRGSGNSIFHVFDGTEATTASGLSPAQTEGAVDAAMATWDGVQCSNLPIVDRGTAPFDIGVVQFILSGGGAGSGLLFGDLQHAGWLPASFFDALRPGGGSSILGVTFTFNWIDTSTGLVTDIDGNGKPDVAFREIYYNDGFAWSTNGGGIDVETVALHEAGHGLSQGHFGKIFLSGNGKLHFSPRAVMNAAYSGIQRSIGKTDNAGHCSNWGAWPNN